MKTRLITAGIGIVVLAIVAGVMGQFRANSNALNQAGTQSLRIGTNVWSGYEPLYLGRSLGHYDDRTVRLVECSSASQVIREFRNKTIEVAALTLDEALLLKADGHDIRVILVTDVSHGGDAILGKPDVAALAELRGRNVGVENTAVGAYVLTRALQGVDMTVTDVNVVPLEVNEHEKAFADDRVDAVVTFDPVRSRLLARGAVKLFDSTQIPGEVVDVLVVRKETIGSHSEQLSILLNGWFSALQYLGEQPEQASIKMADRLKLDPPAVLASFDVLKLPNLKENVSLLQGSTPELANTATLLAKVMVEKNLLAGDIDVSQLCSAQPLKQFKDTPTNE